MSTQAERDEAGIESEQLLSSLGQADGVSSGR